MPILPLLPRCVIRCLAVLACAPALAFAAAKPAAPAAAAAQPPSMLFEFISILLPVAVVIAALLAVLHYLRKRHGLSGRDAPLSILQILPVGPRERIVVLRTRSGRALAVGVAGQSLNLIAELDPADIAPAVAATVSTATATVPAVAASTEHES
ncbi:FliO/MopB family protein [Lysobacter capsici]|uniref:FliO/MopB family protein n=1 Tax=Lysobacter capsici TaxID=435897 RepID=UPI00071677DD|nr:flagellar biosynthetic protein FliO [Lysobacter capsici]